MKKYNSNQTKDNIGGCFTIFIMGLFIVLFFNGLSKCSCSSNDNYQYSAPATKQRKDVDERWQCPKCKGTGRRWVNHGRHGGSHYITCEYCNGSGSKY